MRSSDPEGPAPLPEQADVAILGAGIMGCGLAWRLSQRGRRVVVIDAASPGAEASGAAAGILAAQIEARESEPLLALALASRAAYPAWAAELREETGLDIGLQHCGVLMLAGMPLCEGRSPRDAEADLEAQRALRVEQQRRGLRVESLTSADVRSLEPALSPFAGGLLFPEDGQVEPPRLVAALVAAARARAVQFVCATVERIEPRPAADGRLVVTLRATGDAMPSRVQLRADQIALCAGSWSSILEGAPLPPPTVGPVRGQMVELFAAPSPLRHVCFGQVASPAGGQSPGRPHPPTHGYLVPRGDGRIVIGSTTERVGFVKQVTVAGLLDLLSLAEQLAPTLGQAVVTRTWSGLRPGTADELPIVGESARPGLFICTGHYRNGILLAPATIDALAARMLRQPSASHPIATLDLTPFSPARFVR